MPRANRNFLPGYVWHLTHRCHESAFLLKFARDRRTWIRWLFEAKKRFGLCVLNYVVTSNHIHLLVRDTGHGEIPPSMQLIAGRTAQQYNQRKKRKGAFWEDRYHATAVATDNHLVQCLVYIDMNMVRAGAVNHPREWRESAYAERHAAQQRYCIVDAPTLRALLGFREPAHLAVELEELVNAALATNAIERQPCWTESFAVGSREFVAQVKDKLGARASYRRIVEHADRYVLKETSGTYRLHFEC